MKFNIDEKITLLKAFFQEEPKDITEFKLYISEIKNEILNNRVALLERQMGNKYGR